MFRKLYLLILFFSIPLISFAVTTPTDFKSLIGLFIDILKPLAVLFATLSLLVFLFGVAKFIFRVGGDEKEVSNGKKLMIYGIIGLFIMFSFYAILSFIYGEFDFAGPVQFPPALPE